MRHFSIRCAARIIFVATLALLTAGRTPGYAAATPTESEWMDIALEALREEPWKRKIFDAMAKNFPREMNRIVHAYIDEAKAGLRGRNIYLPHFPTRQIQHYLRPEVMVAAPDAELSALAKALAVYARGYRNIPATCRSLATGGGLILEPSIHEDFSPQELEAHADLLVASIHAARAGRDRPMKRPASAPMLEALIRGFAARFSGMLDLSAKDPVRALSEDRQCDFLVAYYAWVASLRPDQAAYFLTHARSLTKAGNHIQDDSPFKLLPVMVLRANTQK